MEITPVFIAAAVGTVANVLIDAIAHAVHRYQRSAADLDDEGSFATIGRVFFSLLWNALVSSGFVLLYATVFSGGISAFLIAGVIWLIVVTPLLLGTRYMEEIQRRLLAVRIYAWMFKLSAVAGAVTLLSP